MTGKLFIGLMSGTSLDGVDAALVDISGKTCRIKTTFFLPYPAELRDALLALHEPAIDELQQACLTGNRLAKLYAQSVNEVLKMAGLAPETIAAIGCHGQTIRHRPELGFSLQIGNPALLAELSGITVISDFRSRDIAAGGQGAPLVPAFHRAVFGQHDHDIAVINIGGIANLTLLAADARVLGFDTGPGNLLMDAWAARHIGKAYDADGAWAGSGQVIGPLLQELLAEPFFSLAPPKSTGRDLFNMAWLAKKLQTHYRPVDVQRTLLELSINSIGQAIENHSPQVRQIYICGGGAHNLALLNGLQSRLPGIAIDRTDTLGIGADWVEAVAFAWLASQTLHGRPGSLPAVTGAKGERILGAIYAS